MGSKSSTGSKRWRDGEMRDSIDGLDGELTVRWLVRLTKVCETELGSEKVRWVLGRW
jgi:hypothetical protein